MAVLERRVVSETVSPPSSLSTTVPGNLASGKKYWIRNEGSAIIYFYLTTVNTVNATTPYITLNRWESREFTLPSGGEAWVKNGSPGLTGVVVIADAWD